MIDAGLGLAIASDYNPGTSPSGNMALLMSMACTQMKLMPEEAFNGLTTTAPALWSGRISLGPLALERQPAL